MTASAADVHTSGRAVIALGGNLGDREATIRAAISDLGELAGVRVLAASGLVESAALKLDGVDESAPSYLNAVLLADVQLTPLELLDELNAIEQRYGRVRETVWGDRTLDLDLIAFGEVQQQSERLTLPHPRAWQRAFVLGPWLQVEADAAIPGRGKVADLLANADDSVQPYESAPLLEGAAS